MSKQRHITIAVLFIICVATSIILSGCTLRDAVTSVSGFFSREASKEEETAALSIEDRLVSAQVNDSQGRTLVRADGEPLTIMAAYETATGGEPRINSSGELETYPIGEVVTYAPYSYVTDSEGNIETYKGGEPVYNVLGLAEKDNEGNALTRAAGELVTHGSDDIVYDENGNRVTYQGEYMTYGAGEYMYDAEGEKVTYPVAIQKKPSGEAMTGEDGNTLVGKVEIMTNSSGSPYLDDNDEIATKQLEPAPPERVVEPPFESGYYYINYGPSIYDFFSAPVVDYTQIPLVADEGVDPYIYAEENGTGSVCNLQLDILGDSIPYFEIEFDLEGYAYFTLEGSDKVLTLAADLRNGVNVMLETIQKNIYPQYKYWDEPLYTVADNQKWIIKPQPDGSYTICSYLDESYVLTVDDQFGNQHANIMLWQFDGREQQKFLLTPDSPSIPKYVEEGTYYISSGLSNWMMMSFYDDDYYDGAELFLYASDQGNGQMFTIKYDKYGFATIAHGDKKSTEVLSVATGQAYDGQKIIQYEYDGGDWQRWIIVPHKHGGYCIVSALDNKQVIDLTDGYAKSKNTIQLHSNNDTFAQSWNFNKKEIPYGHNYENMDDYAQNFSSETEYLILINSWSNVVGVYKGEQGKWKNIYYFECVTGKESTPTVQGEFSIYAKSPSFDGNMDSPSWYTCYYASMFYPEYFFHSIIYYQGTWDIMDSTMGYSASHGCVRLYTDNAQWIYDNIPLGTKVVSY